MQRRPNNTFISFLIIMLLMAVVNTAWGEDKRVTPVVTFSATSFETTVGSSLSSQPTVSVTVEGSTTPIRSRFRYNYTIIDSNDKEITTIEKVNGKDCVVDPTTGSYIQYRYGTLRIGDKRGSFSVKVTATPTDRWKDEYNSNSATYTVTVNPVAVTMHATIGTTELTNGGDAAQIHVYSYNDGSAWKAVPTALPHIWLNGSNTDYTSYYNLTYALKNGEKFSFQDTLYNSTTDDAKKAFLTTTDVDGTSTDVLTITATPKDDASKAVVGDDVKTFTVNIDSKRTSDHKIKTYIDFLSHELTHYRMSSDNNVWVRTYDMPIPIIKDENGNDVTKYFDLDFGYTKADGTFASGRMKPENVFNKYSDDYFDDFGFDEWGKTWDYSGSENTQEMYIYSPKYSLLGGAATDDFTNIKISTNEVQTHPDDYLLEVKATACKGGKSAQGVTVADYSKIYSDPVPTDVATPVKGMFYGKEKDDADGKSQFKTNEYHLKSNELIYHCMKRGPKIDFSPDPSTVSLANNFEMVPDNRFILEGSFVDNTMPGKTLRDSLSYADKDFSYCIFIPDENLYKTEDDKNPKDGTVKVKPSDKYWESWNNRWVYNDFDAQHKRSVTGMYVDLVDADGNLVKDADGVVKRVKKDGTLFFTKRGWGNDNFCLTFYGTGKVHLVYTLLPSNTQGWDAGSAQAVTYTIVNAEPTYLRIEPKEIITQTGVRSVAPSVRVLDQFDADVTGYFNLAAVKNDATDYNFTLGDNSKEDEKYTVVSYSEGEYKVKVNAEPGSEGEAKHFSTPTFNTKWGDTADTYDNYSVIVKNGSSASDARYEVIYDDKEFNSDGLNDVVDADGNRTVNNSKMGKLHFVGTGNFLPGTTSLHEIPGLTVRFGTADEGKNGINYTVSSFEDEASLKDNDNDAALASDNTKVARDYLLVDGTVVPDGDNIPTAGFIEIDAITNGYLTIDAKFRKGELWILRDMLTHQEQQLTSETDFDGEKKYRLFLHADHRYALWSDQMSGYIHGLSFDPAFVSLDTDEDGWHSAVAFLNGYTGTLPKLLNSSNSSVNFYVKDIAADGSATQVSDLAAEKEGKHAIVNNIGQVSAVGLTTDGTLYNGKDGAHKSTGAELDNHVVIMGDVLGKKDGDNQIRKRPHYNLYIGNMPTYIVEDGANFDQGNRISTNNIPTRIWMTIGGWEHINDSQYPYQKMYKGSMMSDSWKTAKMDSVGRDNMTIDNFNYGSFGAQNALDEDLGSWNSFRQAKPWNVEKVTKEGSTETLDDQRTTFHAPVRGTYLKFEPEESGRVFLYVLQNGLTDIAGDDWSSDDKKMRDRWNDIYLRRRALYIVDETGKNVDIPSGNGDWSGSLDKYLPTGQTSASRFPGYTAPNKNYYCDGITRVGWADAEDKANGYQVLQIDDKPGGKYSWVGNYDHTGQGKDMKLTPQGEKNLKADMKLIEDWWKTNSHTYVAQDAREKAWEHAKLGGPNEVLKLSDGGYVVPTKGYVRYTFNVKSGKTYYVFMTGSKLGFCGFGFLPQGYETNASLWLNAAKKDDQLDDNSAFKETVYESLPKVDNSIYDGTDIGSTVTLDATKTSKDDAGYEKQIATIIPSGSKSHQFVNVNLKKTLRNKRWQGICLPFSVSETQVKSVFGDDAVVVTFDSVRYGTGENSRQYRTVHFTRHVVQNIEAGRPYFIYPDKSGLNAGDALTYSDGSNTVNGVQFKHVTFEGVKPMTIINYNDSAYKHNNGIFTYGVCGIYDKTGIPFYSYYMKATAGEDNYLSRVVPKSATARRANLAGYNAYLFPYSNDVKGMDKVELEKTTPSEAKAKASGFWIRGAEVDGGDVTGIDEIVDDVNIDQTNFVDGVYTTDGLLVRHENNLEGLPAGVYIMSGKKYTVK